jgi:ABC-2 type transport system permease protein
MPTFQVLIFGYVVTTDVKHIPTGLFDLDNTPASRELAARFVRSGYFDLVEYVHSEARARDLLDRGKVQAILRVNCGFEGVLGSGRSARVQLLVDGTDSSAARIVLDYAARIVQQFSEEILTARLARPKASHQNPTRIDLETRAWFNENLESRNFYVPGVIAMIVSLVSLMLTSMSIVREKEMGTMEQIIVTPIRPMEFVLGKTVPFGLIALADVLGITIVGVFWFGVPIRGNLLLLLFATGLYLIITLSAGLLISTISRTQQESMISTFLFYFPTTLLSGFIFPVANMPKVIQWLTYFNPLRYFLVIIRGIFLKGVGINVLWPQMMALAIMGLITLWFTSRKFQKTLA